MSDAALKALLDYRQADEDGVMVVTSRQAIHEVADQVGALKSALAKQMADNICETATLAGTEDRIAELEAENARLRALLRTAGDAMFPLRLAFDNEHAGKRVPPWKAVRINITGAGIENVRTALAAIRESEKGDDGREAGETPGDA